jgi:hypothetical protein
MRQNGAGLDTPTAFGMLHWPISSHERSMLGSVVRGGAGYSRVIQWHACHSFRSHQWEIDPYISLDGVKVGRYIIASALFGRSGVRPARAATICHEAGHFFGVNCGCVTNAADDFVLCGGGPELRAVLLAHVLRSMCFPCYSPCDGLFLFFRVHAISTDDAVVMLTLLARLRGEGYVRPGRPWVRPRLGELFTYGQHGGMGWHAQLAPAYGHVDQNPAGMGHADFH